MLYIGMLHVHIGKSYYIHLLCSRYTCLRKDENATAPLYTRIIPARLYFIIIYDNNK